MNEASDVFWGRRGVGRKNREPVMSETQALQGQEAELQEAAPNAPEWNYAAEIPEADRARMTEEMIAAFKTVYDPEIPCDIYELGLVYKIDVDDSRFVKVDMTLTAPGCPVAGELAQSMETAVGTVAGTAGVTVSVVFDPPWSPGRMSEEAKVALDMF
jgi:FeS assembly SUF system protein